MNRWQQLAAVAALQAALMVLAWQQPRIWITSLVFVVLLVACLVYGIEAVVKARLRRESIVWDLKQQDEDKQRYIDSRGDAWEAERTALEQRCANAEQEARESRIGVKHYRDLFENERNTVATLRRQIAVLEARIRELESTQQ